MLANNELAIARLYQAYGKGSGSGNDFWTKLSKEEMLHSDWVTTLTGHIEKDGTSFKPGEFVKKDLEESISEIQEEIDRVGNDETGNFSHEKKLVIALGIEKDMLEKELFECFETENGMLKKVLKQLKEETAKHNERIANELEKERSK